MKKFASLSHEDFKTFSSRRHFAGQLFSLSTGGAPGQAATKISCVISKKAAAKAHERNLIRRRFREAIRSLAPDCRSPLSLVFRAKYAISGASYADIRADIERLVTQLRESGLC